MMVLLFTLSSAGCESGDDPPDLYTVLMDQSPPEESAERWLAGARSAAVIQIDDALLQQAPERLRLRLPGGRSVIAARDEVSRGDKSKGWLGAVTEEGQVVGHLHLLRHSVGVSARIELRDRRYEIHPRDEVSAYLYTMDEKWTHKCPITIGAPPVKLAPSPEIQTLWASQEPGSVLDVVALYPSEFTKDRLALERLRSFVARSIDAANDIFSKSNVDAQYRLVGLVPLTGPQPSPKMLDALGWLMDEPAEVRAIRDEHYADIVALFLPLPDKDLFAAEPYCGIAAAPQANGEAFYGQGRFKPFMDQAFSVHRAGCGLLDYTFAHEIGHNFSMFHSAEDSASGKFSFASPFIDPFKKVSTVMGCIGPNGDIRDQPSCRRVPYFSGLDSVYAGGVLGSSQANNAEVARLQAPLYARFRDPPNPPPGDLPPLATFTYRCTGLQCTFDGQASSDDRGIRSYGWNLPNQKTARGAVVSFFMPGYGRHEVQLVVIDTSGQRAQVTQTIDLAERSVTPRSGLYWDPDRPGTGFDLFRNAAGEISVTWYTFNDAGSPVWYHAEAFGARRDPGSWSQAMREYQWSDGRLISPWVGGVSLEFSDENTLWFTWAPVRGSQQSTRMVHKFGDGGRSAAWYDKSDPGWGLFLKEEGGTMVVTMAVYEKNLPRWVQGVAPGGDDVTIDLFYLRGGSCTFCAPGPMPQQLRAGSVRIQLMSAAPRGVASFDITMPEGRMRRSLVPIEIHSR